MFSEDENFSNQKEANSAITKVSSTLLSYIKSDSKSPASELPLTERESSATEPSATETSVSEPTLNDVMDAIQKLNLQVSDLGKHHKAISKLAFEDNDLKKHISAMKNSDNIYS